MPISAGDAVIELGVDNKKLDKGLNAATGKINSAAQKWGKRMKIAGGIMMASVAAIGGVSLKMAADFDSAMREVNTMMLLSEEEFKGFSKEVKGLAKTMGVDAVESAKALYQAISAGVPKENVLEFLKIATEAAIGGVTDTETAVDGLTTVINAFKLPMSDAQKVADIMFTTVKGGKTTFDELSASMFQVAPIAAASGVSFEEVSAALATMTKQGVPTAIAVTQLRQAMVALQKPTADMNKVIESLGYESGQAMLEELGLAKSLDVLRNATDGNNEMLMKMFGSVEAGAAVLALTGENAEMFAADIDAMTDAAGAATDAFDQMEQSTTRQMEKMKSQVMDMAISIGTALMPALQSMMKILGPIIERVGAWLEKNPKLTVVILAGVAALGALLLVGGFLLPMFSGLTAATAAFGITLHLAIWPVTLIALGIAALIAIGILLWKNWDTISAKAKEIWDKITSFFKKTWEKITGFFKAHWKKILGILFPAYGIFEMIRANWDKIKEFLQKMNPWEWIKRGWEKLKNGIKDVLKSIFGGSVIEDWTKGLKEYFASQDLSPSAHQMMDTFIKAVTGKLDEITWLTKDQLNKLRAWIEANPLPSPVTEVSVGERRRRKKEAISIEEFKKMEKFTPEWVEAKKELMVLYGAAGLTSLEEAALEATPEQLKLLKEYSELLSLKRRHEWLPEQFGVPMEERKKWGPRIRELRGVLAPLFLPETTTPLNQGGVNIYVELDGEVLMRAIGQPMIDEIRLKAGVRD